MSEVRIDPNDFLQVIDMLAAVAQHTGNDIIPRTCFEMRTRITASLAAQQTQVEVGNFSNATGRR